MGSEHRWIKFWPQDWQRDPALRCCSIAARGLWIDLICIMHEADPYGHLLINGKIASPKQIGTITGIGEKEASKLLKELEDAGVFSRQEDGTIYSRRMVRDKTASDVGRQNGKRGGNPHLKGSSNPMSNQRGEGEGLTPSDNTTHKPTHNGGPNLQEAEAEFKKQKPPMPPLFDLPGVVWREDDMGWHAHVNGYYLDVSWDRVSEVARLDLGRWTNPDQLVPLKRWLEEDIGLPTILAAIRRVVERGNYSPPFSLQFFDRAVREQPRQAA